MYAHSTVRRRTAATLIAAATLSACSADLGTNPTNPTGSVSLAVATHAAALPAASRTGTTPSLDVTPGTATNLVVTVGQNTLELDSVSVVFARVVLRKGGDQTCGDDGNDDAADANCAEMKDGPILVSLPLAAGAQTLFDVSVPQGTYTGMALHIHKPNRADSGPNTAEFLAAHPEWENKSIRVVGKFNGTPFVWFGDPVAEMEQSFDPALKVGDTNGLDLTLKIDVASWFTSGDGALLDPATTSYPTIALNIANSFRTFEDRTRTGNDDNTGTQP